MPQSAHGPADAFSTSRPLAGRAVAHRRRVMVALLQQAPHGVTGREMQEATGFSTALTVSALTGLFVYGVVHKQGHCAVLTAPAGDARTLSTTLRRLGNTRRRTA